MPEKHFIVPIPGIQIDRSQESAGAVFLICSVTRSSALCCPRCQSQDYRLKAYRLRKLKHGFWDRKLIVLQVRVP